MYRRIAHPLLGLLRRGVSPSKLAWSLAAGLLIGINPIIGSTTVLCLACAVVFRLNIVASQLANHVVYPLQLVLVVPFIRLGILLFHTAPMPLSPHQLFEAARHHPLVLLEHLWLWESHALLLWAACTAILLPSIALALTPLLQRLLLRAHHTPHPQAQ